MDKSTNSSNSNNFVETNKKAIDVSFFLIIILILISTFASAKSKYGYKHRYNKNREITIGIESGIVQRKMIYNINNYEQKYLEMAHRISVSKKINPNLSVELSAYNSFTNTAPNTNYSYSDNNTIIGLSTVYTYQLFSNLSIEPKIGIGWMQHHDHTYINQEQLKTKISQSQILLIGTKLRLQLSDCVSLGSGIDVNIGDKNHIFPYAQSGLFLNLFSASGNKFKKCPSRF